MTSENRRQVERPPANDEQATFAYEQQMRNLMASTDVMEAKESKYANLQHEDEQLQLELESLKERKKNIRLINDQVGGWTSRVAYKM